MDVTNGSTVKTSWADDVEDFDTPRIEETIGPDGVRTVIEYTTNEEGRKVKASLHPTSITRKIKPSLTESTVDPVVAARKSWAKFGAERGKPVGLDRATTTLGENVGLELVASGQKSEWLLTESLSFLHLPLLVSQTEPEVEAESDLNKRLENKKIACRLCKGAHFTAKCPYRYTVTMDTDEEDTPLDNRTAKNEPAISAPACVYKPLVCFGTGAHGARESTYRSVSLEDMHTLRVTNVSEETDESDLRDLFGRFGRVLRVYIAKDRETGVGKGYAFVGFENKADAEKAIQKTNGMGYDNLILSVSWSQPKEQR
ncbi:translation initiation factor eIF3 subunit g [Tulasnella sp. 424]|nr:translation initiation factor eIF3 subunit g [Tulasnella sp. 424]